jgi:hypothetical protein
MDGQRYRQFESTNPLSASLIGFVNSERTFYDSFATQLSPGEQRVRTIFSRNNHEFSGAAFANFATTDCRSHPNTMADANRLRMRPGKGGWVTRREESNGCLAGEMEIDHV